MSNAWTVVGHDELTVAQRFTVLTTYAGAVDILGYAGALAPPAEQSVHEDNKTVPPRTKRQGQAGLRQKQ